MSSRRAATVAVWLLSVTVALLVAGAGAAKVGGDPAMIDMFDRIGAGQWFRYVVGGLELAGGVGLLVPRERLRMLAASGLVVLLLCATAVNLTVLRAPPWLSLGLALAAAGILSLRRGESSKIQASVAS